MNPDPRPSDATELGGSPSRGPDTLAASSTERPSVGGGVPAAWLDRLILAHCSVRAGAPLDEGVTQMLTTARELLDDVAVGVCIPRPRVPPPPIARSLTAPSPPLDASPLRGAPPEVVASGQLVIRLAPERKSHPFASDPARLFPEFVCERVLAVNGEGATLHVATDDEARFGAGTPAALVIERLALMLGSILEHDRAVERSLRELRAQVIQSEKLASLGQIAAGIVHELNNPLTTIVAYSDFLRKKTERKGGDPSDVERLSRINEAAERILRFSRDLTAYSRPAGEVPAPVAIHDVIERALVFCEHELDKTGVMVERSFGEVRAVRGVAGQLTQVFVNLFTNAAHAMQVEGGLLSITTSMRDDEVTVTVSDDGHGIEEEHRARIFEPFFTTKTDGTGTGLGLSIVRSIVRSHGGRIRVDGNEPRGTIFHVELPTAAAPQSDH